MTEKNGEEVIKCSCCKCYYFEREYSFNRLGTKYKTCNKCRNKRIMYQENYKKKKNYEKIIINENNNVEKNITINENNNLVLCVKCKEYVNNEEAEYNELTKRCVCILCIMNYNDSKNKLLELD